MNLIKMWRLKRELAEKKQKEKETDLLINEDLKEQLAFNKKTRALIDKRMRLKLIQDDQRELMKDAGLYDEEEEEEEEKAESLEDTLTKNLLSQFLGGLSPKTPAKIDEFGAQIVQESAKTQLGEMLGGMSEEEAERLKRGLGV